jgi:hypothetical protein
MGQGLVLGAPRPVIATRAPTTSDFAELGTLWVNKTTGTAYYITRVVANSATWSVAASTTAAALAVGTSLTVGTTATIGTGLTVTAGGATIGGNTSVTGSFLASTTVGAGTSIAAGTTVTGGTGVIATTGGVTATAGNIVATAGNISTTAGSITSATSLTDIVCSTATHGITLPGPIRIITGAGDPAAGLAVSAGDIYIRTDPASAVTRMFIATAANTWTNVTCAA